MSQAKNNPQEIATIDSVRALKAEIQTAITELQPEFNLSLLDQLELQLQQDLWQLHQIERDLSERFPAEEGASAAAMFAMPPEPHIFGLDDDGAEQNLEQKSERLAVALDPNTAFNRIKKNFEALKKSREEAAKYTEENLKHYISFPSELIAGLYLARLRASHYALSEAEMCVLLWGLKKWRACHDKVLAWPVGRSKQHVPLVEVDKDKYKYVEGMRKGWVDFALNIQNPSELHFDRLIELGRVLIAEDDPTRRAKGWWLLIQHPKHLWLDQLFVLSQALIGERDAALQAKGWEFLLVCAESHGWYGQSARDQLQLHFLSDAGYWREDDDAFQVPHPAAKYKQPQETDEAKEVPPEIAELQLQLEAVKKQPNRQLELELQLECSLEFQQQRHQQKVEAQRKFEIEQFHKRQLEIDAFIKKVRGRCEEYQAHLKHRAPLDQGMGNLSALQSWMENFTTHVGSPQHQLWTNHTNLTFKAGYNEAALTLESMESGAVQVSLEASATEASLTSNMSVQATLTALQKQHHAVQKAHEKIFDNPASIPTYLDHLFSLQQQINQLRTQLENALVPSQSAPGLWCKDAEKQFALKKSFEADIQQFLTQLAALEKVVLAERRRIRNEAEESKDAGVVNDDGGSIPSIPKVTFYSYSNYHRYASLKWMQTLNAIYYTQDAALVITCIEALKAETETNPRFKQQLPHDLGLLLVHAASAGSLTLELVSYFFSQNIALEHPLYAVLKRYESQVDVLKLMLAHLPRKHLSGEALFTHLAACCDQSLDEEKHPDPATNRLAALSTEFRQCAFSYSLIVKGSRSPKDLVEAVEAQGLKVELGHIQALISLSVPGRKKALRGRTESKADRKERREKSFAGKNHGAGKIRPETRFYAILDAQLVLLLGYWFKQKKADGNCSEQEMQNAVQQIRSELVSAGMLLKRLPGVQVLLAEIARSQYENPPDGVSYPENSLSMYELLFGENSASIQSAIATGELQVGLADVVSAIVLISGVKRERGWYFAGDEYAHLDGVLALLISKAYENDRQQSVSAWERLRAAMPDLQLSKKNSTWAWGIQKLASRKLDLSRFPQAQAQLKAGDVPLNQPATQRQAENLECLVEEKDDRGPCVKSNVRHSPPPSPAVIVGGVAFFTGQKRGTGQEEGAPASGDQSAVSSFGPQNRATLLAPPLAHHSASSASSSSASSKGWRENCVLQ